MLNQKITGLEDRKVVDDCERYTFLQEATNMPVVLSEAKEYWSGRNHQGLLDQRSILHDVLDTR